MRQPFFFFNNLCHSYGFPLTLLRLALIAPFLFSFSAWLCPSGDHTRTWLAKKLPLSILAPSDFHPPDLAAWKNEYREELEQEYEKYARYRSEANMESLRRTNGICPISEKTIIFPLLAPDGRIYDSCSIKLWLDTAGPFSPFDRSIPIRWGEGDFVAII